MTDIDPASPVTSPYHHGDLRRALLEAAQAILDETGRWDFSLREVARRAGVSHNAPYRHFADREALLAAIGVTGFDRLRAEGIAAVGELEDAPDVLAALGKAYVSFGLANPALYRLMFGQALSSADGLPDTLMRAVGVASGVLHDVILRGAREGTFDIDARNDATVTVAAVSAWSLVHGVTLLTIDRVVDRDGDRTKVEGMGARVVDLFVAGLRST